VPSLDNFHFEPNLFVSRFRASIRSGVSPHKHVQTDSHIAFLVEGVNDDIEEGMATFKETLDFEFLELVNCDDDYVDIALYRMENTIVELMAPTEEDGWPYRYWRENGTGFFHIAFEVDDIDAAINQLSQRSTGMQTEVYEGVDWSVATMDEADTLVPMQLVEDCRDLEDRF